MKDRAAGMGMYILGVDVGTTGTKAVLVDDSGKVRKKSYRGYELVKRGDGQVEQRAEDWWEALVSTVRECTDGMANKEGILAISLSTQGQSFVPVDARGAPLMNAISWMDKRGDRQLEDLLKLHEPEFYYRKSGWKLIAGGNLIQTRWLFDNKREVFKGTHKFLSTLDYLNFRLTGEYVIDLTNAGITQFMDISAGEWDPELLEAAGISSDRLSDIREPGLEIGTLTEDATLELGLPGTVRVFNGAHDQYCAALGAGLFNQGDLLLATGTAWIVTGMFDRPVFDVQSHIAPGRHVISGLWGALASIPTGGVSMEWYRDNIALKIQKDESIHEESFREVDERILGRKSKADGLFFYPYFNGSGFPKWNGRAKAAFLGLGLEHDRYDMALAIMEGLAFEAKEAFDYFKGKGCDVRRVKMLGGAAKSSLWPEIVASVSGMPVVIMNESDAACMGAAILAGSGCGLFGSYRDGFEKMGLGDRRIDAEPSRNEEYRQKFIDYKKGIALMENYCG